ncbi:NUDE protein, partial [Neohortaea acidophila]
MTSSPIRPGASLEEALDYYKRQYEQLETDLAEFQASSKELEEQLERDIENAEKSERKLREQLEKLTFEVEEWKTKHKQAKAEANSAQNALQKEITTIRESNRAMQLKLRDIEVVNDDYERQARNTESSLEDLESKCNVAIERGVLLEEEVRSGEQEREALRIETQRLRDELSELKVESEITQEKLRLADATVERLRSRKPSPSTVENLRTRSPGSEVSRVTPSSPSASTPPPKSDTASEALTPPSPALSDALVNGRADPKPPIRRSALPDTSAPPRPVLNGPRAQLRQSRGPSATFNHATTNDPRAMRPPPSRPRPVPRPSNVASEGLPRSDSLYQIRNLRGRMQKIEERVQSARAKLPPPKNITPKGSPRSTSSALGDNLPTSITMRRSIRQPSSNLDSQADGASSDVTGASDTPSRRQRQSYAKRPSFGFPRPPSAASDRPVSAHDRPPSAANVRPASRVSMASSSSALNNRPGSRTGAHTPMSPPQHRRTSTAILDRAGSRPGGGAGYSTTHRTHRPSASVGELRRIAAAAAENDDSS